MKTRINHLAVVLLFAIILIAGNVNAADHRDVKASSHENIEATLELESWMMDENVWNTATFHYSEANETNLEIENWMTDQMVWGVQSETLTIENWMVNENYWEVESALIIETQTEQELCLEPWMINQNIWKL